MIPLVVHHVFVEVFCAHGLEGAGAHMQRHGGGFNSVGLELRQNRFIEVQAGGWRGNGTRVFGIDRLVAGFVVAARGMRNIGWQRQ